MLADHARIRLRRLVAGSRVATTVLQAGQAELPALLRLKNGTACLFCSGSSFRYGKGVHPSTRTGQRVLAPFKAIDFKLQA